MDYEQQPDSTTPSKGDGGGGGGGRRKSKLLRYEWESAKFKPHARIVSRKKPPPIGFGSGAFNNIYGLTRFGKARAPHAVLLGKPIDIGEECDGPFGYSPPDVTGKYKPNALIVSRPKMILAGSGGGKYKNIFGMTRFGKANPPRPVIISRHYPKDKREPGPGAYDPYDKSDKRCCIGISITGRPVEPDPDCFEPEPGPNAYMLPKLSKGPAYSIVSRHYTDTTSQSPGPIYDIRDATDKKKGLSMTFKPFPMHEDDVLPGPAHYGVLPGIQSIKETRIQFPRVKFGKEFDPCYEETPWKGSPGPGPAGVNLAQYHGTSKDKPHAIITSRQKFKSETCGSGRFENLFGKTRFGPRRGKRPVIIGRHEKVDKCETPLPGPGSYDPYINCDNCKIGITIKSRLPEIACRYSIPGPGAYNLKTFMGTGPAFSMVKKYFHNLEELERVPARRHNSLNCLKECPAPDAECKIDNNECPRPVDNSPCGGGQLNKIDNYMEYVCQNKTNQDWDPCTMIPFLESLATSST